MSLRAAALTLKTLSIANVVEKFGMSRGEAWIIFLRVLRSTQ